MAPKEGGGGPGLRGGALRGGGQGERLGECRGGGLEAGRAVSLGGAVEGEPKEDLTGKGGEGMAATGMRPGCGPGGVGWAGEGEGHRLHVTDLSRVGGRNNKGGHSARVSLRMRFHRFCTSGPGRGLAAVREIGPSVGAASQKKLAG